MLVSACIITYNQENYIEECIKGALYQKIGFDYEIVIGDDCSNDNTSKICREYALKYPSLIRYERRSENFGMNGNWRKSISSCKGEYVALCEGDDYWTDPFKLQKQVDFLEANNDYAICFHKIQIFNQKEHCLMEDDITRDVSETTDITELVSGNFIHTPSVMFKNDVVLPKWFSKSPLADWTLYMLAIKDRKIKKLDSVMAVYRVHNESVWALKTDKYRILNTINSFKLFLESKDINPYAKEILKDTIRDLQNHLSKKENIFKRVLNKVNNIWND